MTLLSIKEASNWATNHYGKKIAPSQISYLLQYGYLRKIGNNSTTKVPLTDLKKYYDSKKNNMEKQWGKNLGEKLNWKLSFKEYREKERTKHVHRLHPYKGKFIPQLVEYFLDDHTDEFKKEIYFSKNDIILDPFCGSGTTLIQANEININSIGIDISKFNSLISNIKVKKHNVFDIQNEIRKITQLFAEFIWNSKSVKFEQNLLSELKKFNNNFFPSPNFKYKVRNKEINEQQFGKQKEFEFEQIFLELLKKYNLKISQNENDTFMDKWYLKPVREEIDFVLKLINEVKNPDTKKVLTLILSRTIRSCRATSHSDLGTLKKPIHKTYYCHKHYKICKPLFSIFNWWRRYSRDTIKRLVEFDQLRTNTFQYCLTGDSRNIDLISNLRKENSNFADLVVKNKIKGIFSSPPYVGLIDYHQQHAYAYDLFEYERNDELEIGPLCKGKGKAARDSYVDGVTQVLQNSIKYLVDDFHIFLVANDRFNLYPTIAKNAGLKIVNKFKRPVLSRVEKDKSAYSETIFHMRGE
ncbi:MAG: site-specific DNA-methyltransferase [Candidatus Cloacimonetes bacterium]|nr:site-specific DNA-methyltransferase [Candidatus Cloacimonadota bacterium]